MSIIVCIKAASVNMRPIVGVWDRNYIYHNDIKLPYCGNLQFVKNYGTQGVVTHYVEGTHDSRRVKAKQVRLHSIDVLKEWGIPYVFSVHADDVKETE